jgi:hypothetical protein
MRSHDTAAQPPVIGPMLDRVIGAQRTSEEIVSYPQLLEVATALVHHCDNLDWPLVWPTGPAAERLVGAAVLVGEGRMRARGWTDAVQGDSILVVEVGAVSPLSMIRAARHARALGAAEVRGCGIGVLGTELDALDAYTALPHTVPPLRTLTAAA